MLIRSRHVISVISIVLILISNAGVIRADVTGSIQGVVRDRSQGVIVGALLMVCSAYLHDKHQGQEGTDGENLRYFFRG